MYNKTTAETVQKLLEKLCLDCKEFIEEAKKKELPKGETPYTLVHGFIEGKLAKEWTHVETNFCLAVLLNNQLYEQTNRN